jgi:pimeloyl-ACP methyl ester carboxylesterase
MIQKSLIVGGLKVNYYESEVFKSEGALVFLHGWQAEALVFKNILEKCQNFVTLDFPGFGKSEIPKVDWDVSSYAEFLRNFLEKLEIKNPILVGHSFGGRVVIKYNDKYGEAKKNILIGSAGIRAKSKNIIIYKIIAKAFKVIFSIPGLSFFKDSVRRKFYKAIKSEDYINTGNMTEIYKKVIQEDLSGEMQKIKVPTTLIWGENDTEAPLKDGEKMHELIQNSQMFVIKNAGHYVFLDQPEEFSRLFFQKKC